MFPNKDSKVRIFFPNGQNGTAYVNFEPPENFHRLSRYKPQFTQRAKSGLPLRTEFGTFFLTSFRITGESIEWIYQIW